MALAVSLKLTLNVVPTDSLFIVSFAPFVGLISDPRYAPPFLKSVKSPTLLKVMDVSVEQAAHRLSCLRAGLIQ